MSKEHDGFLEGPQDLDKTSSWLAQVRRVFPWYLTAKDSDTPDKIRRQIALSRDEFLGYRIHLAKWRMLFENFGWDEKQTRLIFDNVLGDGIVSYDVTCGFNTNVETNTGFAVIYINDIPTNQLNHYITPLLINGFAVANIANTTSGDHALLSGVAHRSFLALTRKLPKSK